MCFVARTCVQLDLTFMMLPFTLTPSIVVVVRSSPQLDVSCTLACWPLNPGLWNPYTLSKSRYKKFNIQSNYNIYWGRVVSVMRTWEPLGLTSTTWPFTLTLFTAMVVKLFPQPGVSCLLACWPLSPGLWSLFTFVTFRHSATVFVFCYNRIVIYFVSHGSQIFSTNR